MPTTTTTRRCKFPRTFPAPRPIRNRARRIARISLATQVDCRNTWACGRATWGWGAQADRCALQVDATSRWVGEVASPTFPQARTCLPRPPARRWQRRSFDSRPPLATASICPPTAPFSLSLTHTIPRSLPSFAPLHPAHCSAPCPSFVTLETAGKIRCKGRASNGEGTVTASSTPQPCFPFPSPQSPRSHNALVPEPTS